jgi:hypothetical protein
VYEINDPTTWPQEMQDYFNGGVNLWSNPESTAGFEEFIQQTRRDLLTQNGVSTIENMNEEQVFNEYLKWGSEHPATPLVFSIQEIKDMILDSLQRDTAIFSYQDGSLLQNGIYADFFPTGPMVLDQYMRYSSTIEKRQTAFANTISIDVLNTELTTLLPSYYGAYGDLIARFRLPGGIDPNIAEGILVHFYLNDEHRYLPLIISYEPIGIPSYSVIVNGFENVMQLSSPEVMLPIRSSLVPENEDATNLSPTDIENLIGKRAHFRYDRALASGYTPCLIFPFNLGIPNTSVILPLEEGIDFTEPTVFPWSSQP